MKTIQVDSLAKLPKDLTFRATLEKPETESIVYRFTPQIGYRQQPPRPMFFEVVDELGKEVAS